MYISTGTQMSTRSMDTSSEHRVEKMKVWVLQESGYEPEVIGIYSSLESAMAAVHAGQAEERCKKSVWSPHSGEHEWVNWGTNEDGSRLIHHQCAMVDITEYEVLP